MGVAPVRSTVGPLPSMVMLLVMAGRGPGSCRQIPETNSKDENGGTERRRAPFLGTNGKGVGLKLSSDPQEHPGGRVFEVLLALPRFACKRSGTRRSGHGGKAFATPAALERL